MHVNVSITVKTVGGIFLFDGGKLEDSEGYSYFFVVFYVRIKIALMPDLWSNKSHFVSQL